VVTHDEGLASAARRVVHRKDGAIVHQEVSRVRAGNDHTSAIPSQD
jgi:ABC-type lipoprotein export system ATPase subunit